MNFQQTTQTTVTETHVQTNLRWDPSYLRTVPGMLKVAVTITDLIGFICVMCANAYWRSSTTGNFYAFVSMTGFWTSSILLLFYLLHVIEKFHVIPWLLIEMVYCAVWAFFFFASSIDTAVNAKLETAFGAAAFFGFVAVGLYGYDAFLKFAGWRGGQLAQGERTVSTSQNQAPAPTY